MRYESARVELMRATRVVSKLNGEWQSAGNISTLVDDDNIGDHRGPKILATPARKRRMNPEDMVLIDIDGKVLERVGDNEATSELRSLHIPAYKHRKNVRWVFHTHPRHVCGLAIAREPLRREHYEIAFFGVRRGASKIPCLEWGCPGSEDLAKIMCEFYRHSPLRGAILANHGCVVTSKTRDGGIALSYLFEELAARSQCARVFGKSSLVPLGDIDALAGYIDKKYLDL